MLSFNLIPAELRKKPNRKPFLRTVLFVLAVLIAVIAGTIAVVARGAAAGRERAADVTTAAPGASSMPRQAPPPTQTGNK